MTWTVKPDVYLAERAASEDLVQQGRLAAPVVTFAGLRGNGDCQGLGDWASIGL
jgi:hypothetical protein